MKKGFTLLELLIVLIIIGILATFAFPQYVRATERAKGAKARNALALISRAEKMVRADSATDAYIAVADGAFNANLGAFIELNEVDVDPDWSYAVAATAATFTVTATRTTSGGNNGETITVTEVGVWGGTFTP